MSALARTNRAAYERLKTQGVKGVAKEEYAEYLRWSSGFSLSRAPAPAPSPSPAPKRKHREAKTTKDERQKAKDERAKADFERKGEGAPFQKASPLDYIRKIQEIAANAPKIPTRTPGGKKFPQQGLESEENTNGKE
ncbi:MAG: hypothetical protein IJ702_04540 [Fretibacterium sp.]|nr:hypothetical protein [Fretibacterium sp.]